MRGRGAWGIRHDEQLGAVSVTVSAGGDDGGGGGDGAERRGGGSSTARQSATVGSTGAATASELPGDKLRIDIHGQPDATFELGIGWVSREPISSVSVTNLWAKPT